MHANPTSPMVSTLCARRNPPFPPSIPSHLFAHRLTPSPVAEMEVEDDMWEDHDEDIHGIIDSEELRKEYPENYTWSCCEKDGTNPGCRSHPHKSRQQSRRKVETSPDGLEA